MTSAIQTRLAKLEANQKGRTHILEIWDGQTDEEAWAIAYPDRPYPAEGMIIFLRRFDWERRPADLGEAS